MLSDDPQEICLSLMHADTENEVIRVLRDKGLWDDPRLWRFYGDKEDNFSAIGNQQSRPEAALVEKVVNSVDAVLMNKCRLMGISPEDSAAPKTIHEAVALFFMGDGRKSDTLGHIANWPDQKRKEVSRLITLSATGATARSSDLANPCFTIADAGEGQTPASMPLTLLSLDKKNKAKIHFVQGKFNMGGTGVLRFCGRNKLQLVVSRRNPSILKTDALPSDNMWSFVIVRREDPPPGQKSSVYTYLAPIGADKNPRMGNLLVFNAKSLPLFPEGRRPYAREAEWGTVIKLYEYAATGFRTLMFLKDGLLSRLDVLLPEIALPIRLYECRDYKGHAGSFETTLGGLAVRLEDNKAENLEEGFPTTGKIRALGETMSARIFAFTKGKSETYRKREGIIFTVNGQTHAYLPLTFFSRKAVGMGRLDDSILVMVDCSDLSTRAREDLFMNSRDRLCSGDLRHETERELEIIIREHEGLRALKEKRKREEMQSMLSDLKPLQDTLKSILRSYPSLASLFLTGTRLSNPFRMKAVGSSDTPYKGKPHPTYFKFLGLRSGQELKRKTAVNMRCRVAFETDVDNDYFDRSVNKGVFSLRILRGGKVEGVSSYNLNLHNGKATLSVRMPEDSIVGDVLPYEAKVGDSTLVFPFTNRFAVTVDPAQSITGGRSKPGRPPADKEGHQRELPTGLQIPDIHEVYQSEWDTRKHKFNQYSALEIIQEEAAETDASGNGQAAVYSFWVNIDNIYFKTEAKSSPLAPEILKARWLYGLALLGMALIQDDAKTETPDTAEAEERDDPERIPTLEERVFRTSLAVAPVLLPLIESLGSLSEEQVTSGSQAGDDD